MSKAVGFLVIAAVFLAGACSEQSPTRPDPNETALPHSMKGYELYSWHSDGTWKFALLTGTDASKSLDEILSGADCTTEGQRVRIRAHGVDALRRELRRLPHNEGVHWIGPRTREQWRLEAGPLDLPPQTVVDAVSAYSAERGLQLHVSP